MRHSALTFAEQVCEKTMQGDQWDLVFATDMLDLATFKALAPVTVSRLPQVVYFHENQLTYPVQADDERDQHFGFTNFTTALAAQSTWFNSQYHCDSFFAALSEFLRRMPDHVPHGAMAQAERQSTIHPPGIESFPSRDERRPGPLRILWAARWEHDKNPVVFLNALTKLKNHGIDFRVSLIGQQFRHTPPIFATAQSRFHAHIDRWGYQSSRQDYISALLDADVFVSTALHEFFGIAAVEAISAGAYPLLPRRLAYPELLQLDQPQAVEPYFYDGSETMLFDRLADLAQQHQTQGNIAQTARTAQQRVKRFEWNQLVPTMDRALEKITNRTPS